MDKSSRTKPCRIPGAAFLRPDIEECANDSFHAFLGVHFRFNNGEQRLLKARQSLKLVVAGSQNSLQTQEAHASCSGPPDPREANAPHPPSLTPARICVLRLARIAGPDQSQISNPQSPIDNPQSSILNPQSKIVISFGWPLPSCRTPQKSPSTPPPRGEEGPPSCPLEYPRP